MKRPLACCSGVFALGLMVLVTGALTLPPPPPGGIDGAEQDHHAQPEAASAEPNELAWSNLPRWSVPSGAFPWTFDLFTPPHVVRDAATGQFALFDECEPAADAADDVELLALLPPAVRLQLVGYIGDGDDWRGVFEDLLTGETHLARAGQTVLGFRIRNVRVQKERELRPDSMPLSQWLAIVDLEDPTSGESLRLTNEAPRSTAPLRARLRFRATQDVWEQAVGTERVLGVSVVRLSAVQTDPPAAEIAFGAQNALGAARWIMLSPP
jgi:hypothetical protein